uniref:ULP_PROTEASE domain-containing protein n=1 Tax=Strongyloides papillosus TaxID=174720 RepID=A0A0N5CES1_STREA
MFRKFTELGKKFLFDDKTKDRDGKNNLLLRKKYDTNISILNSRNLYGNHGKLENKKESKLMSLFKSLINRKNETKSTVDLESKSIFNRILSETQLEKKTQPEDVHTPSTTTKKIEEITISSGESSPIVISEEECKTISIKESSSEVETITISSKEESPDFRSVRRSKLYPNENFLFKSDALEKLKSVDNNVKKLVKYSSDGKDIASPKPNKIEEISIITSPYERSYDYDENSQFYTPQSSSAGSRKRAYNYVEDEKRMELRKKIKYMEMEVENQLYGMQQTLSFRDLNVPKKNFVTIKILDSGYKKLPRDINDVFLKIDSSRKDDVLSEGFSMSITKKDIQHLDENTWLNDNIINFYMELIMDRSKNCLKYPKVYAFNTFFYQNISNPERGYKMVKRWTRKIDIFQMKYIFVPINLNNVHWCMAIIDVPKKEIRYCDSMRKRNTDALNVLKNYIKCEAADKLKIDINLDEWTAIHAQDVPEQQNGYDCGVFSCMFAEYTSRERDFEFTQNDMPLFRQQMKYEIIKKDLVN